MEANRALDAAVKAVHEQDRDRADALADFLVTMPPKRVLVRVLVRVLEHVREEGAALPEIAHELAIRRRLAMTESDDEPTAREIAQAYQRCVRVAHGG